MIPAWLGTGAAFLAVSLAVSVWSVHKVRGLNRQVEEIKERALKSERERDSIHVELFRRLYEQRELDRQKMRFEGQLAEYEKYAWLAQLALGAAHEINNPLLGILSHPELELKVCQDSAQRSEIEKCIAGPKRISATLRGVVDDARPSPPVLSKISLARLVIDTITLLEHQPILRGKILNNAVPPDLPCLWSDSNQLSQVLMNLLLNSAEATGEGGQITVSATKLAYVESVEIRVVGTGIGIPREILPHVLEPFLTTKLGRGDGTRSEYQLCLYPQSRR